MPQLTCRGLTVRFTAKEALVLLEDKIVARAVRHGACYIFDASNKARALAMRPSTATEIALWHRRFGHADGTNSTVYVPLLLGCRRLHALSYRACATPACAQSRYAYIAAKLSAQRRNCLSASTHISAGQLRQLACTASKYLLTLTDEFSRKLWAFATRNRVELYALY
jgi:hypothetical protein